jgi:hypothetical protein
MSNVLSSRCAVKTRPSCGPIARLFFALALAGCAPLETKRFPNPAGDAVLIFRISAGSPAGDNDVDAYLEISPSKELQYLGLVRNKDAEAPRWINATTVRVCGLAGDPTLNRTVVFERPLARTFTVQTEHCALGE